MYIDTCTYIYIYIYIHTYIYIYIYIYTHTSGGPAGALRLPPPALRGALLFRISIK